MNSTRGSQTKSEPFKINWVYFLIIVVVSGAFALAMYAGKPTIKTGSKIEIIVSQGEFFQVNEKVSMEAASTDDFILKNSTDNTLLGALENPTDYFRMSHDDISGRWEVKQGSRVSVRFSGTPGLKIICGSTEDTITTIQAMIFIITLVIICLLMIFEFTTR